jgi:ankyrin repeat protein
MILINGAMWDSLRKYLTTEEGALNAAEEMTSNEFCEPGGYENDGCIAMHLVVRAHPPLDIVASLMRFNPCLTAQLDAYGRTPLHVAAASGASPQVVRFLLQQDVSAAAKLDYEGKTPLHLCCEKCCTEGTCDPGLGNGQLVKGPTFEVLKMLAKAFPDSLNREDQMEMSPLEHAIVNGADVKVVKLLQKLSVIEWRKVAKEDPDFYSPDLNFDTVPDDSPPLSGTCHVPPSITKSMSDTSSLSEASLVLPAIVETRLSKKVQASSQPLPNTYDSYFQTSDKSGQSWPTFTEASLLKAVLKASSDNDDAPSVTSYCTKLSTSVGGRVTAHRRSRSVRRRSACNAAA